MSDTMTDEGVEAPVQDHLASAPSGAGHPTHVVLRPFSGSDTVMGEFVDASTWRSVERLTEARYIRPISVEDPEPVTDGQGRFFIDDDTLLAYIDSVISVEPSESDDSEPENNDTPEEG